MSAAEIMAELPRLSHSERRLISERLLELEAERDALLFAAAAADAAFVELDRMEEKDGNAGSR